MVVPVNPLSRVATSSAVVGVDWEASWRSVQPVGAVVVVSPLATPAIVTLPVRAAWLRTGAGVDEAAWLDWDPLERTAACPVFDIPLTATATISAAVLDPVATVMVVDVVLAMSASRTKTLMRLALALQGTVPT
jgi:hypothetical protein